MRNSVTAWVVAGAVAASGAPTHMMLFCPLSLGWLRVCGCVQKLHQVPHSHSVCGRPQGPRSASWERQCLRPLQASQVPGEVLPKLQSHLRASSGHSLEGIGRKAVSSWPRRDHSEVPEWPREPARHSSVSSGLGYGMMAPR